ncbi:HlyD family secretion protein [Paracoccus seriniphilus]|uniref:HlyD family secretion protein n=1 Tax=Paracoccus seriniphilus TaxID=184748 RepID=UPI0035612E5A
MRKKLMILLALAAAIAGSAFYLNRPEAMRPVQSTNNAYLRADYTNVAPRLSATVAEVLVRENQFVEKGQIMARMDDRDQRIAVQTAEAALQAARANLDMLESQAGIQASVIEQAEAALDADRAALTLAQTQERRARELLARKSGPQSMLDEAISTLASAEAKLHSDTASRDAARRQLDVYDARKEAARAAVAQAEATLADARLRLSYMTIKAPISGTIGQLNLRKGAFVPAGTTLAAIVPLQDIYIEAMFRETQLARVRPGQPVTITVDAIPDRQFRGRVDSIGPASGASFTALPAQNATGNFTKITQRLPVRIALEPDQPEADAMRVGMSVISEIHVDS